MKPERQIRVGDLRNKRLSKHRAFLLALCILPLTLASMTFAQGQGGPQMRKHTATKVQTFRLVPTTQKLSVKNSQSDQTVGNKRILKSNGIPAHRVGIFPNQGNPHTITEQNYRFSVPAYPKPAAVITSAHDNQGTGNQRGAPNRPFGIALNGVLFDPGTAEFWNGDRSANWNYEALGGSIGLGLDGNHAHVQPTGAYHYHGLPENYLVELGISKNSHSPQVGWAADGFPIYALYGYQNPENARSPIIELSSSYRLKRGRRPNGNDNPGGKYDGAFLRDYEFVRGSGSLDECNGRFCVTPEFPDGTYAYFLTNKWPVVPRNFRGTPTQLRDSRGQQRPHPGRRRRNK